MHQYLDNGDHPPRKTGLIAGLFVVAVCGLSLAGCSSWFGSGGNDNSQPDVSAFNQALSKDYDALAQSVVTGNDTTHEGFFSAPFSYLGVNFWSTSPSKALAKTFAEKSRLAAKGTDVEPEPATDSTSQMARTRLVQALVTGRDKFPDDAARAQADYDCWMLDAMVPSQADAAAQCQTSLNGSLARLVADVQPPPPPPPPPPPAPPPESAVPSGSATNYTVYFEFDSWTLSPEDLRVLTDASKEARAGGEKHITIVGHTDTSGPADYNKKLSVERANVAKEALVDMGVKRKYIKAWGVGETDLAVPTADGVREPKNRRSVIDLKP